MARKRAAVRRQYQFGLTFVTPLALTVEQRIPVAMNSGMTGRMSAWS